MNLGIRNWNGLARAVAVAAAVAGLAGMARAENWPQWRGPFFNGSTTETNLTANWSRSEKVAWVAPLPGRSGATPVVWGNFIFLPSPDTNRNLLLYCLDKISGKVLWNKKVGEGERVVGKNNLASCSAVTDGQVVCALFATSDMAGFDFDGNCLWQRKLSDEFGGFANMFLYGASPTLYAGKLYVPLLQRNPPTYGHAQDGKPVRQSFLICLDPATGKTVWKQERKTDAREEAMEAYTTPIPHRGPDGMVLILAGADCVTAHRPDSGEELWRYAGLNRIKNPGGRIVPSPVTGPGLVFACGPKREVLAAIKDDGRGIVGESQVAWKFTTCVPDVGTPLYYQGKLFVLDGDRQVMVCFKPATGEQLWLGKLGVREIFAASPTGADGKIYCISEEGTVVVLSAGDKFQILSTISMGESPVRSSIVISDGLLLIRTGQSLYAINATLRDPAEKP